MLRAGIGAAQQHADPFIGPRPVAACKQRGEGGGPARLDDVLSVSVDVIHLGQASLEIAQQARRADELLAEATIRIGCVELGTFRPCRIPNDIRDSLPT